METLQQSLTTLKICRFCLSQTDQLSNIYEKYRAPKNSVTLPLKILSCMSIEVLPSDKMPIYICNRCKFFMDISYEFKHMCRQADEHILQYVHHTATALTPMTWSQPLLKLFRLAHKSPEVALMKTVVEGGATVHVTAQESDSDEEDDENVYNVKIGDGSDEGSKSTRVKVITADKDKGKPKRGKVLPDKSIKLDMEKPAMRDGRFLCEECDSTFHQKSSLQRHMAFRHHPFFCRYCPLRFSTVTKLAGHIRTHAGDKTFPCKYCNKTFTKAHHHTRHLRIKHRETIRTCRGPFGESEQYRCEQCEDSFTLQDDLIYHSAIHATQNLTCPLCQEKFDDIDAVTAHIKSHVNGTEFMCDLCELVFTTQEKLDAHLSLVHDDEVRNPADLGQDESSVEMDVDDEEFEAGIDVKEVDDHMVVEIKKPSEFMISKSQAEIDEKTENTNSEESEPEVTFSELATVDTLTITKKSPLEVSSEKPVPILAGATLTKTVTMPSKITESINSQNASILRKAEEIKKKVTTSIQLQPEPVAEKKIEKISKSDNSNTVGASDKSLRLLEKELQELKRTNTRSETVKTPAKTVEFLRSRRAQIHTSTPKLRAAAVVEEKKVQAPVKSPAIEKKVPERRVVTKENKEPKESKETKTNNVSAKEDKEVKEKETPKNVVKNGSSDKINPEEGIRRSTRPSKIKDYAKMIRDRSQDSDENDDSDDSDDEEYKEIDKSTEIKKVRRPSIKPVAAKPTPTPVATPAPRKRGRPRKEVPVAPKIRKEEKEEVIDDDDDIPEIIENESDTNIKTAPVPTLAPAPASAAEKEGNKSTPETAEANKSLIEQKQSSGVLVSPTGQTLKKIPIKALPPGVKPLPLPVNARPMGGELCEMQIGKKVVKVQKIVMTKAEVEAMAKKGLVEMKGGTMVLKQGIKIPTADPTALKTSLVGEDAAKESPSKKATPSRCDFGDDA